ncbi:MAG: flagellar biosynthesis protein FliQ [Gemmatimonadota bacterium]
MSIAVILDLAQRSLSLALMLAGPLLGTALVVGVLIGLVQAVTSIQEQTLSFVPKLFAVGAVFLLLLSWMLRTMMQYTAELFRSLPGLVS